jgi:hypothetical protein
MTSERPKDNPPAASPPLALPPSPSLASLGLGLWLAFGLIQAVLPNGVAIVDTQAAFSHGAIVALGAALIRAADPRGDRWLFLACYITAGLLHPVWMLVGSSIAVRLAQSFAPTVPMLGEFAMMFAVTGLVLGTIVVLDVRRWWATLIVALAAALSVLIADQRSVWNTGLNPPHAIGLPALPLHLGLAATLWLAWLQHRRARPRSDQCSCGYSLAGVRTDRCPECGARTRPLMQAVHSHHSDAPQA